MLKKKKQGVPADASHLSSCSLRQVDSWIAWAMKGVLSQSELQSETYKLIIILKANKTIQRAGQGSKVARALSPKSNFCLYYFFSHVVTTTFLHVCIYYSLDCYKVNYFAMKTHQVHLVLVFSHSISHLTTSKVCAGRTNLRRSCFT